MLQLPSTDEGFFLCELWLWTKEIFTDKPKYENIFSDNVFKQVKVNKYFVMNYKTREKYILEKKNENKELKRHEILYCDPLSSLL